MPKITDFGLAIQTFHDQDCITICGTPLYMAPELWRRPIQNIATTSNLSYRNAVDMSSLGIILYVILSCETPFETSSDFADDVNPDDIIHGRYCFDGQIWTSISKNAQDLVTKLMCVNPSGRLAANQVREHQWLSLIHI